MARILVVDDDPSQLELRCHLLAAGGHEALAAFSPSEAMRRVVSADLVMMDLRFPNERGEDDPAQGLALIRSIRESGSLAAIIVLSGWPQCLEGQAEAQLVSRVLTKPIGLAAMLQAIADALGPEAAIKAATT